MASIQRNIFVGLLLLSLIPDLAKTRDAVHADLSTYDDPRKKCANVSLSLPGPEDDIQRNASFENGPMHHSWLGVRKVLLEGWMTLSGHRIDEYQEHGDSRRKGKDCAVLRSRDEMIDEVYCNKKTKGFICSYPGGVSCLASFQCATIATRRVLYTQQMVTWFEAQQACFQLNLTLMEPPVTKLQQFAKEMSQRIQKAGHYAIGMVHSIWMQDTGYGENDTVTPSMISWDNNEPSPLASCAVMSEVTLLAKAVACSTKAAYFCVAKGETEAAAKRVMTSLSPFKPETTVKLIESTILAETVSGMNGSLLPLVIVLCVIIVFLAVWIAILTIMVCRLKQKQQFMLERMKDVAMNKENEEDRGLLDGDIFVENDEFTVNVRNGHVQLQQTSKVEGDKIIKEGLKALHQDEPALPGGSMEQINL